MKKAYTLIITLFTVLFVSFAIITFMYSSSINQTSQYQKDLAQLRVYWAAYGAKERDQDKTYFYHTLDSGGLFDNNNLVYNKEIYKITGEELSNLSYSAKIIDSDTVNDKDIYIKVIRFDSNEEEMHTYKYEN